ncbi:hypothetical protein [Psychromonas ossibalaenae]|uniref:hypothetical protein n=1 Tax=Psychromonas ossibalaenae TaxID=444922 RepID=UPI00037AEA62|nr:hypothetical protein [Psychromonas ossibalaenae]
MKGFDPGTPPPSEDTYVEGFSYREGDVVSNYGSLYECKPHPYTGWCAGAAWAYEPGKGTAWQDAWTQL